MKLNVKEGDILIGEFMNASFWCFDRSHHNSLRSRKPASELRDLPEHFSVEISYQTSWDWLMPVIDKIEGTGHKVQIMTSSVIITHQFKDHVAHPVFNEVLFNSFKTKSVSNKLENTWKLVVEFIKWYNEQKVADA